MKLYLSLIVSLLSYSGICCDCDEIFDYDKSKEVFIGQVTKLEWLEETCHIKVTIGNKFDIYKGDKTKLEKDTIEIFSICNVCGYYWDIGDIYLIFVEPNNNDNRIVNMCSSTSKINYLGESPTLDEVKSWREIGRKKWSID